MNLNAIKFSPLRVFTVFVLLLQVVLFISLNTNLDALADPFRHEQRKIALVDWANTHTPESLAKFDNEVKLLDGHLQKKAFISASVLIIIDGIGIYCIWKYGSTRVAKRGSNPD